MEHLLELLGKPEVLLLGTALIIILMMLIAIMIRMTRRDKRIDEMHHAIDERFTESAANTETRLNQSEQFIRASVEQMNDGVAHALADAEHSQAGRIYEYTQTVSRAIEAESSRSRTFNNELGRKVDEMDKRTQQQMDEMRISVVKSISDEISAKLGDTINGLNLKLDELSKAADKLRISSSELSGFRDSLNWRRDNDIRLDALMAQWLSLGRYVRHFEIGTGSGKFADFAIMLPDDDGQTLYLPVDSSFPVANYSGEWNDDARRRLSSGVNAYAHGLESRLIKPGLTTDFAIMLIPDEAVCARVDEVGYDTQLMRKVIPTGPAAFWTLVRLLEGSVNAIEMRRRSEEMGKLLFDMRGELRHFSDLLNTGIQLQPGNELDNAMPAASDDKKEPEAASKYEDADDIYDEVDIWG